MRPMIKTDIQIAVCGSAGDGTIATGDILNQAMARAGYRVIAFDVYPAEIRGFGECIACTRITSEQVYSLKKQSDMLVSLNDTHAIAHVPEVRDYGAVIYDDAPITPLKEGAHISGHIKAGQLPYGLPMRELSERATSAAKSRNMVALGFVAGLYGLPREVFHQTIAAKFKGKADTITEGNIKAFDAGFEEGERTFQLDTVRIGAPTSSESNAVVINGNRAVVRGCLDAKVATFFGYPITPATTILEMLAAQLPKQGGKVLQTEDEISAIGATIGAGYTGARAATATSGPGLALMTEMLGLGVMAEVPCVIFVSQRGGPSTGMPTKTEQSDLNLAVFGGSGDAPRIVLAPTNVEGCYKCAGKAFELAETYQAPVIVLLDLYLSNRLEAVSLPAKSPFAANLAKGTTARDLADGYARFALTEDHISPRALPGQEGGIHTVTGLEHTEAGRPKDSPEVHNKMTVKRHDKLAPAVHHPDLTTAKRFGDEGKVDVGILTWGSTFGEALEAVIEARNAGIRCAAMKVVMLSPLPIDAIRSFCEDCQEILVPELNHQGQFANLVTAATARSMHRLDRVSGRPMHVEDIVAEIRRLAGGKKRQIAAA